MGTTRMRKCRYCGGMPGSISEDGAHRMVCSECGFGTPCHRTMEAAARAWQFIMSKDA